MPGRIAYIPLNTYPEGPSDAATMATIGLAETMDCGMHVATFAVDIPPRRLTPGRIPDQLSAISTYRTKVAI
jgi:hypothetical protein